MLKKLHIEKVDSKKVKQVLHYNTSRGTKFVKDNI